MKMYDHECDIVCDLLPLYIENRTGCESSRLVQSHLEGCMECSEIYRSMTAELPAVNIPDDKGKKRHRRHFVRMDALIAGIFVVVYAVVLCVFICWFYNLLTEGLF